MGMPCEVNSILKLNDLEGLSADFSPGSLHKMSKEGYRIVPLDVPLLLVDVNWQNLANVAVRKLIWENKKTDLLFEIIEVYENSLFFAHTRVARCIEHR